MKHHMKIFIGKEDPATNIVRCRNVRMRERLLRFLFGEQLKVTIIVPGKSVDTLAIKEVPEEDDESN